MCLEEDVTLLLWNVQVITPDSGYNDPVCQDAWTPATYKLWLRSILLDYLDKHITLFSRFY